MKKHIIRFILVVALGMAASVSHAAGILTPTGSKHQPVQIRDHHVNVVINNGFAMTEVHQTFYNPNPEHLEALYSFPLPKSASLVDRFVYQARMVRPKVELDHLLHDHAGSAAGENHL